MIKAKVDSLVADLRRTYGEKSVMYASEIPLQPPISSGSLALDFAIGHGGMPSDRVVEICGREGTGKSTLSLLTMQQFLHDQPDRGALILDLEHKMSREWLAQLIGPDLLDSRIIYIQPDHIEQATNIYRRAVTSGQICFAMLDSIGGAPTIRRNDDAEVGHYGGNAIGVGEFGRTAATLSAKYRCLTIGINQTRADMSGYHALNTPGGTAWKHAVVCRIELVKGKDAEYATLNGEKMPVGHTIYAKIRKNQLAAPGRTAMWWMFHIPTEDFGFGIDTLDEVVRLGIKTQVLTLKGGWYHHPAFPADAKGEHKVQGLLKVKEAVRSDEALRQTLCAEILASLSDYAQQVAPISDPDAPVEIGSLMIDGEMAGNV